MSIDNSKIRKIILVEHEGLRINLRAIEELLDKVEGGDVDARKSAHQQLTTMLQTFLRHIEHEERILQPVLAQIDAWGPQRSAAMTEEHKMQRGLVMQLTSVDPAGDPKAWVRDVRIFAKDLLMDMADEEKTCLSPNVLRDDVVVVDGSSE
ncbi:MAG: hemerythrin domain-containing protein [Archangium sp.]|nr:hemerythrin domain-containing protein [Archangium sp.]